MTLDAWKERRRGALARRLKAWMRRLQKGNEAHIIDATEITAPSCANISLKQHIASCWIKAQILLLHIQTELVNSHGNVGHNSRSIDKQVLDDVLEMLSQLFIRDKKANLCPCTTSDVTEWFQIGENQDIVEAEAKDALEGLETTPAIPGATMHDEGHTDIDREAKFTLGTVQAKRNVLDLGELFRCLQSLGSSNAVCDILSRISAMRRRFKRPDKVENRQKGSRL